MPHIHYKYDFAVAVYIVHKNRVLMVNHPRYDMWIPMGGHVELDEDPEEALFREVKEETGLKVEIIGDKPSFSETKSIYAPRYIDVHEANAPHKHINMVYFARSKSDKYVLSSEHTAIEWLGLADLNKPKYALSASTKFYCKQAIAAAKV